MGGRVREQEVAKKPKKTGMKKSFLNQKSLSTLYYCFSLLFAFLLRCTDLMTMSKCVVVVFITIIFAVMMTIIRIVVTYGDEIARNRK